MKRIRLFAMIFGVIATTSVSMMAGKAPENMCICETNCQCCTNNSHKAMEIWPDLIEGWISADGLEFKTDDRMGMCVVADYQEEIMKSDKKRVWGDVVIPKWVRDYEVAGIDGFFNCTLNSIVIPEGIREIRGFRQFNGLTRFEIPSGVKRVKGICDSDIDELVLPENPLEVKYSFNYLRSLKKVTVGCRDPYDLSRYCFIGSNPEVCTLVVPAGSIEAYCAADVWKSFGTIMDTDGNVGKKEAPVYSLAQNDISKDLTDAFTAADMGCQCGSDCPCCKERHSQDPRSLYPELISGWIRDDSSSAYGLTYSLSHILQECRLADYGMEVMDTDGGGSYGDVVIPAFVISDGMKYDVTCINSFNVATAQSVSMPEGLRIVRGFNSCSGIRNLEFPAGVLKIDGVKNCYDLEEIVLPGNAVIFGSHAFRNLPSLKKVTVRCPEPYALSDECFEDVDLAACTLVVPVGSLEAYCAADRWRDFGKIVDTDGRVGDKKAAVDAVRFSVNDGHVTFSGDPAEARIMTVDGRIVGHDAGASAVHLPKGIYIISLPGLAARKIVIK